MKRSAIVLLLFLLLTQFVKANIINVPGDYSTIQLAINASPDGDTVLVEPGTYFENINFRGKKIVLTSRFYINNDLNYISSTIINGSTPANSDTASCVIINNGEDSTTVLQGFTLTGGTGTKWLDEHGAGLYREGGGILIQYSSPVIQFNVITSNQAITGGVVSTGGGGIRIGDSYPRVYNNIFINNTGRYGAGIVLNYTGGEYKNNVICKNYGSLEFGAGSGIWVNGSYPRPATIENNTIVFNSATNGTSGIYSFGGAAATVRNNIVWGNTSPSGLQISGGNLVVRYCNVQGGFTGAGNINQQPVFGASNYYLAAGSSGIDAGDSSVIYNDPEDPSNPGMANYPALGTIRNDMGAYGGQLSRVIANMVVNINDPSINSPTGFKLYQNYPNPFNPSTVISYSLKVNGDVTLKVFDVLGKEIATLVNENLNAGAYEYIWNAEGLPGGVYFYNLTSESFTETRKMILLR